MTEAVLLNTNDAAKYCGLSRSTFLRFVKSERIPAGIKLGPRAIRWHVSDLDKFIERCRTESSAA